jgi:prepilin-type N-terminal cleavage/methylation domain-containing protein
MKLISFPARLVKRDGFTLVELLVVVAIIAILAAVILSAGGAAIRAAQRAKAANLATQIQTAALNYYTEYSVYPVPSTFVAGTDYYISDGTSDQANWGNLIEALCGNISPHSVTTAVTPAVTNTRGIAFLQLKASDVDAEDAPLNPISFNSTANPYFNIVIDSDYSGIVGDTGTGLGKMPNFSTSTQGSVLFLAKGASGGIAVWANCNTTTTTTQWNPNFFVHTY